MKIRIALTGVMADQYDKPLYRDAKEVFKLTMKDVMMAALLAPDPPKQGAEVDQEDNFEKYRLYARIKPCLTSIDVTNDELTTIKDLIGKNQGKLIQGQAWEILNNSEQVKDSEKGETKKSK